MTSFEILVAITMAVSLVIHIGGRPRTVKQP